MKCKKYFNRVAILSGIITIAMLWGWLSTLHSQQFPIGAYWVRNPDSQERHDQYTQVAACSINIVVGGTNYYSDPLGTILDAADANGIQLIVNNAAPYSYIYTYSNSYRLQYETAGYHSNPLYPRLVTIETPIFYEFDHPAGVEHSDPAAEGGSAMQAVAPGTADYLIYNYAGGHWQEPLHNYYASFRLKISGDNTQHIAVARLMVVRDDLVNLVDDVIYADEFIANEVYQEFEYSFTSSAASSNGGASDQESYEDMLPEGNPVQPLQVNLDYRVYWYGQMTLWADYVSIEDINGDRLFDGIYNNNIQTEARNAHSADPDHDTVLGFYNDEPNIYEIKSISRINELIDNESPPALPHPAVINATINQNSLFHQYLNAGAVDFQDYKLLVDRYPIQYGSPIPGQPGYNNYIQGRWDDVIPYLSDAGYVSSLNGRTFWYAVQAHSWDFPPNPPDPEERWHRDPAPTEIRCMINLGLAYGAKGIFYFLYTSIPSGNPAYVGAIGLVDVGFNHNYEPYLSKWNEVRRINNHLQRLAATLLNLTWQEAHSIHNDPAPHQYISQLTTTVDNPTETYIELALFEDSRLDPNVDYFMVVNRRCQNTETRTVNVTIHKDASTYYFIRQILTGTETLFQTNSSGNYTFIDNLNPGQGKLYMLKKARTGTITTNQTWYEWEYVTGNVTVNSGVALTILPGTTIKFTSATGLKILGTFTATGTSAQHIRFTSSATTPAKGSWAQIKLENSQNTSVLDYCDVEYATIGIWCQGSSLVTLRHLNVNNCKNWGLYLLTNSSNTTVENSRFTNTDDRGIFLYTSSPDLINVTCTNNKYGLFCYNKSEPDIGYSHFSYNTLDGIYCSSTSRPWMYYHATYFPNRGWNRIESNTGRGVAAFSSSYPYMGLNSSYPGNNIIEQNGGYEIYNGNSSGWIWAIYNWWETPTGPLAGDLYTDQTVKIDPVNPNPKPTTAMIAGLAKLITNSLTNTDSLSDPQKHNLIGTEYLVEGKYQEAKEAFEYIITYYPKTEEAKYALVHITSCYEALSRISDIIPYLETVSNTFKGSDLDGFALALSVPYLEKEQNYKKAIERCQQIRGFYQDKEVNKNLLFIMANIYFYGLKDDQNAKIYFEDYVSSYPDDPMASTAQMMLEIMGSRSLPKQQPSEPVSVNNLPTDFVLSQNYPNPCNPETEIKYQLPEATTVTLKIYNLMGQEVRALLNIEEVAGYHVVRWNGKDDQGNELASGIYIYQIEAGWFIASKKLVLIR